MSYLFDTVLHVNMQRGVLCVILRAFLLKCDNLTQNYTLVMVCVLQEYNYLYSYILCKMAQVNLLI